MDENVRCEGWRRRGGAFTLGPVTWKQCENDAVVMLTVTQDGKTENMPARLDCWREAIDNGIYIASATPIVAKDVV